MNLPQLLDPSSNAVFRRQATFITRFLCDQMPRTILAYTRAEFDVFDVIEDG